MKELDLEGITARLRKLDEYDGYLKQLQELSELDFVGDFRLFGSAERYLQLSIECLLDIGQMIIAGLGLPKPEKHQEVIDILAGAEIISHDLAARLEGAGGFRNILVHDYLDIDRHIVYRTLQDDLDDIRDFAAAVAKFVSEMSADVEEGRKFG
ncbi:MAG: DUF86 domain-containing protein [Chloroflexi bacterium]|nr:DUF86 domain-containing protein [Chloroflexota bacterium]